MSRNNFDYYFMSKEDFEAPIPIKRKCKVKLGDVLMLPNVDGVMKYCTVEDITDFFVTVRFGGLSGSYLSSFLIYGGRVNP